jgi:acetolactate synthase-1/2/3 large subunit
MNKKVTAAEILVQALKANGTTHAFCVPGESYLSVLDSLYDAKADIDLITCRQEGGAANMAEAHAKLTGRVGICLVTRGPGATNASIGLHTAMQDSTPMILFIGQVARDQSGREAFQEIDYRKMFGSIVKWAAQIESADRMAEYVTRAFHIAQSGRKGPVVLALPEDMLCDLTEMREIKAAHVVSAAPSVKNMSAVMQALQKSKKPVVILGGSGWDQTSVDQVEEFIIKNNLPAACSFRRQDLFNNNLKNYIGDVGIGINPKLFVRVKEADLVLVIGSRMGEMMTSGYRLFDIPSAPEGGQELITVHASAETLGSIYRPDLAINAGMDEFAEALSQMGEIDSKVWAEWTADARADYEAWSRPMDTQGDVNIGEIYRYLQKNMPSDAIMTNGAGNYAIWLHRFMRHKFKCQLAPTSGAMGYGLPAAVGAKATSPERPVVCFAGDGCFMMNGQELATAMHHDLKIIILVFNNGIYGTIRMHQEKEYPARVSGTELTNPDFAALAEAYGARGVKVEKTEEFAPAFEAALKGTCTTLIEIKVDPEALTPAKTLSEFRNMK